MKDIIDLRKRREKHFKNDDGTFSVQLYNEDIHYKYDGKYYDVDNTLVDEGNFYVNRTNSQITTFSKDSDFLYEINIDDFLAILVKEKSTITANEMLLDKQTREGTYSENISILSEQIIPDYFNDKSILEKILTIKSMMQF